MADEEMMYRTTVGPLPVLTDPSTWAPARARKEARLDGTETLSHATFRGIDPAGPANPLAKQTTAMPHARIPSLDDHISPITVVRRRREVGYGRLYLGFLRLHLDVTALHRRSRLGGPHDGPVDDGP